MFQSIEANHPKLTVVFQPALRRLQWPGFQAAMMVAPENLTPDQAGAFQHLQMLGNGVEGNAERCRDFGHPRRACR